MDLPDKKHNALPDKKHNALRAAMHDLADEYVTIGNTDFAETIRTVADDPAMILKFAALLVHYDTPAAACEAMIPRTYAHSKRVLVDNRALRGNTDGRVEMSLAEANKLGLNPGRHLRDGKHEPVQPLNGADMLVGREHVRSIATREVRDSSSPSGLRVEPVRDVTDQPWFAHRDPYQLPPGMTLADVKNRTNNCNKPGVMRQRMPGEPIADLSDLTEPPFMTATEPGEDSPNR